MAISDFSLSENVIKACWLALYRESLNNCNLTSGKWGINTAPSHINPKESCICNSKSYTSRRPPEVTGGLHSHPVRVYSGCGALLGGA
jgi:hypothetical protein